ncbi:MAG TPA: DUF1302 domain-containing protein [Nevskiales bacterium]|nr:DUF1302 domain-containing protein [Nevskiales bacterium]
MRKACGVGRRFSCSASLSGLALLLASGPGLAFDFDLGELRGTLDNQVSLGAAWRAEDPDERLISKSNLNPGLCLRRESDGSIAGDGCNSTSDPSLNNAFVAAPGNFAPNADNGNLNYDKGDLVAGAFKITSDLNLSWRNFGALFRASYFYDEPNTGFEETHPDTTFQPRKTDRPKRVEKLVGHDLERLDSYVFGNFPFIGDRQLTVRVGDQVLNWGESTFLVANSLNHIAPPHLPRLRAPSFDVKELFVPVGMIFLGTELMPSLALEAFYQYDWKPAVPDPVGSFYSTSDIAGEGGTYAMLSFGKAPEDPTQSYDPKTNADITCLITGCELDRTGLFSSSSRTILRAADRRPDDGGQYGFKVAYFAEDFNSGTEFAFYHSNTHSRLPIASFLAADATCIGDGSGVLQALSPLECGPPLPGIGPIGALGLAREPLPVETARVFLEYPEDIKLYGLSFNTTIGDWAWSGEVAYRPNQPLQIHSTDLTLAALQPAFPAEDIPVCVGAGLIIPGFPAPIGDCLPGLPLVTVIPGRRSAVPDFVETRYRGHTVTPGAYIQGYEEMKVANFGTTFLNTISASNPLKADQIVVVFELGATKVFDMPGLDELQFNAAGADTHISNGADGSTGLGGNTLGSGCLANGANASACHQNPQAENPRAFPDDLAWGFRTVWVFRYQDAFLGVNLEPLVGWFKDIDGIAPGPGENFIEGRSTYLTGLRWDYLNQWSGELRYTIESGGRINNPRLDRDVVTLNLRYEF